MSPPLQQLTLNFEPGLAVRHASLLECVATCAYRQDLKRVAGIVDMSPSHLGEALGGGGDRNRKFGVNELEAYIAKTGDTTPILYLVAKYLRDPAVAQQEALSKLAWLAEQLPTLLQQAGMDSPGKMR